MMSVESLTVVGAGLSNFGGPNLLIILLVILLLFGAKKLPELARGMGQAINEFNKAKDDVQRHITSADQPVIRKAEESRPQTGASAPLEATAPATADAKAQEPRAQA